MALPFAKKSSAVINIFETREGEIHLGSVFDSKKLSIRSFTKCSCRLLVQKRRFVQQYRQIF